MATHSGVPAWRIPGTGEPGGLPSMGSHRLGHDWSDLAVAAASNFTFTFHFHALEKEMATHSSVLAWRIPGMEPGGLPSMGSHRVGHDWSDLAAAAAVCIQFSSVQSLGRVQLFVTPWTIATRLLCSWDSPGKNTGMGCHFFLQGIFLTQGSNPGLLPQRKLFYHLSHQRSYKVAPAATYR